MHSNLTLCNLQPTHLMMGLSEPNAIVSRRLPVFFFKCFSFFFFRSVTKKESRIVPQLYQLRRTLSSFSIRKATKLRKRLLQLHKKKETEKSSPPFLDNSQHDSGELDKVKT